MANPATPPASLWTPSFVGFVAVMACDFVFCAYFTLRPRPKSDRPRRAPLSVIGIALQVWACGLIGGAHRFPAMPLVPMSFALEVAVATLATLLAAGSLWVSVAAVVTLGKQWTYVAEVSEGHQLVTAGPYARLRHPIYAGMTGLVIASAIVAARWWVVPIILAAQLAGTWVRAREEDRLLRQAHGPAFDAYAARVPAIFPRLRSHTDDRRRDHPD